MLFEFSDRARDLQEQLQAFGETNAMHRVAADADRGGLAKPEPGCLFDSGIGQRRCP